MAHERIAHSRPRASRDRMRPSLNSVAITGFCSGSQKNAEAAGRILTHCSRWSSSTRTSGPAVIPSVPTVEPHCFCRCCEWQGRAFARAVRAPDRCEPPLKMGGMRAGPVFWPVLPPAPGTIFGRFVRCSCRCCDGTGPHGGRGGTPERRENSATARKLGKHPRRRSMGAGTYGVPPGQVPSGVPLAV